MESPDFSLIHQHFLFDAFLTSALDEARYREVTQALMAELITSLGMEELGPLAIFPAADLRAPGWSFLQPITTSHISGHYFAGPPPIAIHMDVYSCQPFTWEQIIHVVAKHLPLGTWHGVNVNRSLTAAERSVTTLKGNGEHISE